MKTRTTIMLCCTGTFGSDWQKQSQAVTATNKTNLSIWHYKKQQFKWIKWNFINLKASITSIYHHLGNVYQTGKVSWEYCNKPIKKIDTTDGCIVICTIIIITCCVIASLIVISVILRVR